MNALRKTYRPLGFALFFTLLLAVAGCEHASVGVGVGVYSSPWGWGNSFSVGISSHHYHRPYYGNPGYRPRRY